MSTDSLNANCVCRSTASSAMHKIDLFAAGFEYNAAAGISLAESRKTLHQYLSSMDELCPIQEEVVSDLDGRYPTTAGGVYAIMDRDSVHLFTLESASRGIPQTKWTIPLPPADAESCGFYPVTDVIAFIEPSCVHCHQSKFPELIR